MRVGAFLCLQAVAALDDEYHHTQLLQTKAQHVKVQADKHAKTSLKATVSKLRSRGARANFVKTFEDGQRRVAQHKQQQDLRKKILDKKPAYLKKSATIQRPRGPSPEQAGRELCEMFYPDAVDECMACGGRERPNFNCQDHLEGFDNVMEGYMSEGFMICHGECMKSPLVGGGEPGGDPEKICGEFYPDHVGECVECGGRCAEEIHCDSPESCLRDENFMDCHDHCMFEPDQGGQDPAERACEEYYPDAVHECLDCGEHCLHEVGCGGVDQCVEDMAFHDCHMRCVGEKTAPSSNSSSWNSSSWTSSSWDSSSWEPADDPMIRESCHMAYGGSVDVGQCAECGFDCAMQVPPEVWESEHPDEHMKAIEGIMTCSDECMGQTNLITQACSDQAEHMGVELDLGQCLGCGMMCGCDANHCDEQCHAECMGFGHEEEHDEGKQMCKDIYGEEVDVDKCLECGESCAMEASRYATSEADFMAMMLKCADDCLGQENKVRQTCDRFDSGDELAECIACGMECCDSFEECRDGHKDGCMKDCIPRDGTDLIQTKKALK